jgi:hypothetical protein
MASPRKGAILLAAGTAAHRNILAQKLVFHKSDLNKSTTICKVGDLEVFPKAFFGFGKVHVYEVYAREVHAYELHAHKLHTHEVHACEVHAP